MKVCMNVGIDNIADYYDKESEKHVPNGRHNVIKHSLTSLVSPGRALDVGCGIGIISKSLAERGMHVTAIDLSPGMINRAATENEHARITYVCADVTDTESMKGLSHSGQISAKYDLIVMADVFEHLLPTAIPAFMKFIQSVSHKETVAYLNIPDGRFLSHWIFTNHAKIQIVEVPYLISDIYKMFETYGFEATGIRIYGLDFPVQYNEFTFVQKDRLRQMYL